MGRDGNGAYRVIDNQFIANTVGSVKEVVSPAIVAEGNKVVLALTITNLTGSDTVEAEIQVTVDRMHWAVLGTATTGSGFGHYEITDATGLSGAFVRAACRITGGTNDTVALISATLAFSEQG